MFECGRVGGGGRAEEEVVVPGEEIGDVEEAAAPVEVLGGDVGEEGGGEGHAFGGFSWGW